MESKKEEPKVGAYYIDGASSSEGVVIFQILKKNFNEDRDCYAYTYLPNAGYRAGQISKFNGPDCVRFQKAILIDNKLMKILYGLDK